MRNQPRRKSNHTVVESLPPFRRSRLASVWWYILAEQAIQTLPHLDCVAPRDTVFDLSRHERAPAVVVRVLSRYCHVNPVADQQVISVEHNVRTRCRQFLAVLIARRQLSCGLLLATPIQQRETRGQEGFTGTLQKLA